MILPARGDLVPGGDEGAVPAGGVVVDQEHVAVAVRGVVRVVLVEARICGPPPAWPVTGVVIAVSTSCHVVSGSASQSEAEVGAVSTVERSRKTSLPRSRPSAASPASFFVNR